MHYKSNRLIASTMICLLGLILSLKAEDSSSPSAAETPVSLVNPLIGSDNCRTFFMTAAARPFGMVKLAPDTQILSYWSTGYQNSLNTIYGFSHLHEWKLGGVPVMPVSGTVLMSHAGLAHDSDKPVSDLICPLLGPDSWKSPFDPKTQIVMPGYQKVHLDRYDIDVELTATKRVGFHRYTFGRSDQASVLVPLAGFWGEGRMFQCDVKRTDPSSIEGSVLIGSGFSPSLKPSNPIRLFFVIQCDRPLQLFDGWGANSRIHNKDVNVISADDAGLILGFGKVDSGTKLQMKVALSYCSIDGARLNLTTELPRWDFDAARAEACADWNAELGRIEVSGNHDRKVKFYTDLWHALLGRGIFSDGDGHYPLYQSDDTMVVKSVPLTAEGKPAFDMHVSDAFWWSHDTVGTLWGLAYPEVLGEFCNSWLQFFDDTGELPMGATVGRVDHIMEGAQSYPLFGRAIQMNLPGVNASRAYAAMQAVNSVQHSAALGNMEAFTKFGGWMPADLQPKLSISFTVEDGFCEWVLSQIAAKLGKTEDAARYTALSHGWTNLYNPANGGWLQARNQDGTWIEPFDPLNGKTHCSESNPAILTWFPGYYLAGITQLMGGREKTIQRLNDQFEKAAPDNFRRKWMEYNNEPGFGIVQLFNLLGDPTKTQHWVREVYLANYSGTGTTTEQSYAGDDEDQGLMGSLSDLMALGLFQVTGGCEVNPSYQITTPMFDRVCIHLQSPAYKATDFVITASPDPEKNPYIQSATLNGKPLDRLSITQDQINEGAHLDLVLSPQPSPTVQ